MPDAPTILLFAIVILLIIIAVLLYGVLRRPQTITYELSLDPTFREQVESLGSVARQHVDVNAVVALIHQIEELPGDIVERLREYPADVQRAALLHYVDQLGADLQHAQRTLSSEHQLDAGTLYGGDAAKQGRIQRAQQHVDNLRAKLDRAVAASGQPVGPRTV